MYQFQVSVSDGIETVHAMVDVEVGKRQLRLKYALERTPHLIHLNQLALLYRRLFSSDYRRALPLIMLRRSKHIRCVPITSGSEHPDYRIKEVSYETYYRITDCLSMYFAAFVC